MRILSIIRGLCCGKGQLLQAFAEDIVASLLRNHKSQPRVDLPSTLHTHESQLTHVKASDKHTMAYSQPSKPPLTGVAQGSAPGLRYPANGKTIYHRPLNRSLKQELSLASFAYLFGEMVSYAQKRVTGIQDLEKR